MRRRVEGSVQNCSRRQPEDRSTNGKRIGQLKPILKVA